MPASLVAAVIEKAGVATDSELLPYALCKVALEDDFGWTLLALKGTVSRDVDLEF